MTKLLIASLSNSGLEYLQRAQALGLEAHVLDCFEGHRGELKSRYGKALIETDARKTDVIRAVSSYQFDVALIEEDSDFVRTALIAQSLREANIPLVIVLTADANKIRLYRRSGAHRVIVARDCSEAWTLCQRYFVANLPA
ncbi:hypothetical protein [Alicyclobacillus tolerans]|uniref:Trk K+ transport system NAD-binding subunit n=1 Tax=Alicyclobacillus tolerans TaxID=90970 RepID=A0ABT9LY39_9BACL|nr:hypothetical protein [Alicyclobacillus tengchongensis]MDP9729182.1 Trk K+ transport system NAD-binding subunit [Alicyclobacillus tengchongensis]